MLIYQSNLFPCSLVCNAGYFGTGSNGCNLCTGNMTKPEAGDATTCDQVCDPESSRPSTDRTECGEYPVAIHTQSIIWIVQVKTFLKTRKLYSRMRITLSSPYRGIFVWGGGVCQRDTLRQRLSLDRDPCGQRPPWTETP